MTSVTVAHGRHEYDVLIGGLGAAIPRIEALASGRALPLVTDANVFALHGKRLAGVALVPPILLPPGESAKDWSGLRSAIDGLAALGVRRGTPLLALGGGSVGDVAGLAAALYMRGCPVIHVPTTLLAQADSAIGGKTAIDAAGIKNLAGAFHHPALVVVDPALLDTLDKRQLAAGYAEVVKYGLINDPAFFDWCERHGLALVSGDTDARAFAIAHCVKAKARVVAADSDDRSGARALLNLGHSFAHAIESAAGIGRLLHGEAVAVGLVLAFALSRRIGHCPAADHERLVAHLAACGLPTRLEDVGLAGRALLPFIARDKKNSDRRLTLVLVRGIGRAFVDASLDQPALAEFLAVAR